MIWEDIRQFGMGEGLVMVVMVLEEGRKRDDESFD